MHATRWTTMIVSVLTFSTRACVSTGALTEDDLRQDMSLESRSVAVVVRNNNY